MHSTLTKKASRSKCAIYLCDPTIKYTKIVSFTCKQKFSSLYEYCKKLEELVVSGDTKAKDEISLLTVLIEKWDADHNTFDELDPIQLLRGLMKDHKLKSSDVVAILGVSKGYVSEILHY